MSKQKWDGMRGEVVGAFGCVTSLLVCIAIDVAIVALIMWLVRTIAGVGA